MLLQKVAMRASTWLLVLLPSPYHRSCSIETVSEKDNNMLVIRIRRFGGRVKGDAAIVRAIPTEDQ